MEPETMRRLTCCFTGHRTVPSDQQEQVRAWLERTILQLHQEKGVRYFGAGGALGFDTMAAQAVLKLRVQYPQLRLILVLPFPGQEKRWSAKDQQCYGDIVNQADKVVYTAQYYQSDCFHRRNRHLVDGAAWCMAYLTQPSGGTAYTVDYARTCGVPVLQYPGAL